MIRRVLIVGSGFGVRTHLPAAKKLLPQAEIAVLARHAGGKAAGVAKVFKRLADAADFAPDIAVIANAAPDHVKTALRLAEAGAHLLIEKPIDASSKNVQALIDLCTARRRVLLVGYILRFSPSLRTFRKELHKAGRIFSVRAEVGQNLEAWREADYRTSVSAQRKRGGGALLELSHDIDYLRWVFGEVAWVSAIAGKQSNFDIDVEDTAHLVLGFARQKGRELVASLNLDFVRDDWVRSCKVIGSKGTLCWDANLEDARKDKVEFFRARPKAIGKRKLKATQESISVPETADTLRDAEWKHFLKCVAGANPLISGADGLAVLKVVEAAKASSRTRKVVRLKP